ncbi:hypothetical protein JB92DRAFT_3117701 [Gautieria morchelliformis]|nr:hypothetical protein JB92DRAFT_3117701 [Gautieria morchelliformis]
MPKQATNIDLHKLGTYYDILTHLQVLWSNNVKLCSNRQVAVPQGCEIFFANTSLSLPYIELDGLRYGASTMNHGSKYCYAYVDVRRPVIIEYIFKVAHTRKTPLDPSLQTTCAVVHPLLRSDRTPEMPWDKWYEIPDLGTGIWLAEMFGEWEIIDVYRFSGHLILCPLPIHGNTWWITMPHDHFRPEIDITDDMLDEVEEEYNHDV